MNPAMELARRPPGTVQESPPPSGPAVEPAADGAVPTVPAGRLSDPPLEALSSEVADIARQYGRNPASATSWRLGRNLVVTALEAFLTPGEQALVASGDARLVRQLRAVFVEMIGDEYVRSAERALGQEVIAHDSDVMAASGICLETFLLGQGRRCRGATPGGIGVSNPQHGRR